MHIQPPHTHRPSAIHTQYIHIHTHTYAHTYTHTQQQQQQQHYCRPRRPAAVLALAAVALRVVADEVDLLVALGFTALRPGEYSPGMKPAGRLRGTTVDFEDLEEEEVGEVELLYEGGGECATAAPSFPDPLPSGAGCVAAAVVFPTGIVTTNGVFPSVDSTVVAAVSCDCTGACPLADGEESMSMEVADAINCVTASAILARAGCCIELSSPPPSTLPAPPATPLAGAAAMCVGG